jgi:lysozyme
MPKCNAAGLAIIMNDEGLRLRAYPDPGSGADPWTIGYGDTAHAHPGQVITAAQALEFLKQDVALSEAAVAHAAEVVLTPNQFSALVSFEYNTGAFATGAPIVAAINSHDFQGALRHLSLYINGADGPLPGLIARRAQEAALFETPG